MYTRYDKLIIFLVNKILASCNLSTTGFGSTLATSVCSYTKEIHIYCSTKCSWSISRMKRDLYVYLDMLYINVHF